jgi:hypothetical protein
MRPFQELFVEEASTLSWFEVKQISCPSGDPGGVCRRRSRSRKVPEGRNGVPNAGQKRIFVIDESSLTSTRQINELFHRTQPPDRVLFVQG